MTRILGITGPMGVGKSTLALEVRRLAPSRIRGFADNLRDVVEAAFGSRYETQAEKEAVDDWWSERLTQGDGRFGRPVTGRAILQTVGTELFRDSVHPDFWLFAMERWIADIEDGPDRVIIPDVRFDNEAAWIRAQSGLVVGLARGADWKPAQDSHASERGVAFDLIDEKFTCRDLTDLRCVAGFLARRVFGAELPAGASHG